MGRCYFCCCKCNGGGGQENCDCCGTGGRPPTVANSVFGNGGCINCSTTTGFTWFYDNESPFGTTYGCGWYVDIQLTCAGNGIITLKMFCNITGVYEMQMVQATGIADYPGPFPYNITKIGPFSWRIPFPTDCDLGSGFIDIDFAGDPCEFAFAQMPIARRTKKGFTINQKAIVDRIAKRLKARMKN